jgi:pyruvate/2-oxoglutarate dehydrogenase complex dihydrolipoamide acyltransferase (E2) component
MPPENLSASTSPDKEESKSSSAPPPPPTPSRSPAGQKAAAAASHGAVTITHDRPLFPSVIRLLQENGVANARRIKGTGIRGMLTKGDVLAHLGLASSPWGTAKQAKPSASSPAPLSAPKETEKVRSNKPMKPYDSQAIYSSQVYDAVTVRALILSGFAKSAFTVAPPPSSRT